MFDFVERVLVLYLIFAMALFTVFVCALIGICIIAVWRDHY